MRFILKQCERNVISYELSLVFKDFLNNSLNSLIKYLEETGYHYVSQEFSANVIYDNWDSFEKFNEVLSSKDKFYNSLTNCPTSDKDYEAVVNV